VGDAECARLALGVGVAGIDGRESGAFPLAERIPGRVGRLRAYGNAIVVPQAVAFIESYLDVDSL